MPIPVLAGGAAGSLAPAVTTVPVLDLTYVLGLVVAAVASLVVVAAIAAYLVRNNPKAFLTFRKLRPDPDRHDDEPPEE